MKTISKHNLTKGQKYYVVLGPNLEYNDNTFYESGQLLASKNLFTSLEDARLQSVEILKSNYGFLKIYEVEQFEWNFPDILSKFCEEENWYECTRSFSEYVDFCFSATNGWNAFWEAIPFGIEIREVEVLS